MKHSIAFWSKVFMAPLLLAASAGASAVSVTFNFADIMNGVGGGAYYDGDSTTTALTPGTERGVELRAIASTFANISST
jgi:hypothetical protein